MSAQKLPKRLSGSKVLKPKWQWLDLLPDDEICSSLKHLNTPTGKFARVAVFLWSDGAFARMTLHGYRGDRLPPIDAYALEAAYMIGRAQLERNHQTGAL